MSPTHEIGQDMDNDDWLSKMRRQSYAGWRKHVEAAREREKQHREAQAWKQNCI